MSQKRQGFTTMVDLAEFEKTTWAFLTNIKMTWQYDGMAYLFREAGIPLYGIDRGTTKMNHPIAAMAIPMSKDKNYGVDIYVPADRKKKAASLIEDEEKLARAAELEAEVGGEAHARFNEEATEKKASYLEMKGGGRKGDLFSRNCARSAVARHKGTLSPVDRNDPIRLLSQKGSGNASNH